MKLGEIVVHMDNYNFNKFYQNQMKNKKVLLIAHFSVQNFKASVELWKLYIVNPGGQNWEGQKVFCKQTADLYCVALVKSTYPIGFQSFLSR